MKTRSTTRGWFLAVALIVPLAGCDHLHGKAKVERKATQGPGSAAAAPGGSPAAPAAEQYTPDTVVSPGIVEPWGAQVELAAQEPGWIAQIAVREGEEVEAGRLLATLEDGAQRHGVELSRAELAEAEAALAKVEHGFTPEELRQAQADHDAAVARANQARATAARTVRLHEQGAAPDADVDRAAADAQAEQAMAVRAEARLQEMKRGARAEDRSAVRARAEAARARLRLAEANLARRRVVAPSAGTVLLSRFHAGEFYGNGVGPLFVLGNMSRLQVRLEVDELDAAVVDRGSTCTLYSDGGVRLAEGTVVHLAPKMGRRALSLEAPTARADVRVREIFVEIPATSKLIPGQRVWGHTRRVNTTDAAGRTSKAG